MLDCVSVVFIVSIVSLKSLISCEAAAAWRCDFHRMLLFCTLLVSCRVFDCVSVVFMVSIVSDTPVIGSVRQQHGGMVGARALTHLVIAEDAEMSAFNVDIQN